MKCLHILCHHLICGSNYIVSHVTAFMFYWYPHHGACCSEVPLLGPGQWVLAARVGAFQHPITRNIPHRWVRQPHKGKPLKSVFSRLKGFTAMTSLFRRESQRKLWKNIGRWVTGFISQTPAGHAQTFTFIFLSRWKAIERTVRDASRENTERLMHISFSLPLMTQNLFPKPQLETTPLQRGPPLLTLLLQDLSQDKWGRE